MRQYSCYPYENYFLQCAKTPNQNKKKIQAQAEGKKKGSSKDKTIPLQILTNLYTIFCLTVSITQAQNDQ